MDLLTFTTDYGLDDVFVGVCHGVIVRFAPHVRVIDLTHGVPAHDVAAGALALADAVAYLPPAVHLAVVDPGVGSDRRAVAVRTGEGHLLVGPDNGLLGPAAHRLGGATAAVEVTEPAYRLEPVSRTFHGRDVFAPAAAHLAAGVALERLGAAVDPATLADASPPSPEVVRGRLATQVVAVDRFGNLALAASTGDLAAAGLVGPGRVTVATGGRRWAAAVVGTFSDVAPDELALLPDAFGRLQLAVRGAAASRALGLRPGGPVTVEALPDGVGSR